jgi:hypothetical protein
MVKHDPSTRHPKHVTSGTADKICFSPDANMLNQYVARADPKAVVGDSGWTCHRQGDAGRRSSLPCHSQESVGDNE